MPVAAIMLCVCMFLLIVPVIQYPERPVVSLAVMLSAVPVYVLLVMEKPFKLRPKFVDALNGE